jgi:hypothetical protein
VSGFEQQIATLMLEQPYMEIDKAFLVSLTANARRRIFEGFYGDDYEYSLDLKSLVFSKDKESERVKLGAIKAWLYEQSRSDFVVTDWLMVGFKSKNDAALFKLFWL